MEDKSRGGKTALHILAFVGVTLLLLVIACLAALYIATKGPSESARANVIEWADEHSLGAVAGLFLSDDEEDAILNPANTPDGGAETTDTPLIIISDTAPEASAEPSPEASGQPESSAAPEESPSATDNGEEASP